MIIAGAGGVVFDDKGFVLVLRHQNSSWVFPKGHIDEGENALQTAIRETQEEAGVLAECRDPLTTFSTSYVNARGEERIITWFILFADDARFVGREDLFPEGDFMDPADAMQQLSFPEDRRLLAEVLAHLEGA